MRSKEKARMNYNRLSRCYDCIAGGSEARLRQMGTKLLSVRHGESVLEVGFGTGHALIEFARLVGQQGWIAGIDISDGMSQQAHKRLLHDQVHDRVGLCIGDGSVLPFSSDSFDAVFISFTLELFDAPEILLVLSQCYRVLKPHGRLVNISLVKMPLPGFSERLYEWFQARLPDIVDCRPIDVVPDLKEAGFIVAEKIHRSIWGLPVEIVSATTPVKK